MSLKNIKLKFLAGIAKQLKADHARQIAAVKAKSPAKTAKKTDNLPCGVEFKTTGSAMEIEEWLEINSAGKFIIGIEEIDDQSHEKTLKIMFQHEDDKTKFLEQYSR